MQRHMKASFAGAMKIIMWTMAVLGLVNMSACSADSGNTEKVTADRPCAEVQRELDAAEVEKTKQADTPNEQDAADAVTELEAELESCHDGSADETTTTTTEVEEESAPPSTEPMVPDEINVDVDEASIREIFDGPVAADEVAFQEEAAEAAQGAPEERGDAAHSAETLRTPEQLTEWLKGSDPKAAPVRQRVELAITTMCGAEDVATHLDDSDGWLLMVVRPGSQIQGTSYFVDGELRYATDWREVGENDAYWLPICTVGANVGKVVPDGIVRADCGNGSDKPRIRIIRENTPPATPVDVPPGGQYVCPPRLPYGEWPVCKDTPEQDPDAQGNNNPGGGGSGQEEGGSDEGQTEEPAGEPDETYNPPDRPPTVVVPPVTNPSTPSSPTTTTAPPNDPEEVAPPNSGNPEPPP